MKLVVCIFLGWIALQLPAQSTEVGKSNDVLKTSLEERGKIIVDPFNLAGLTKLKEYGYNSLGGGNLKGSAENNLWWQHYCLINRDHFPARPVRFETCVIVVQTLLGSEPNGAPIFKNEDAIQIKFNGNDLRIFDSDDTYCSSTLYPERSVFAIGLWKWRNKPQVGGYAYSLRNAWVVDPESKRLKEIPTNGVKCEIDEDRD